MTATTAESPALSQQQENGFASRLPRPSGGGWKTGALLLVGMLGLAALCYGAFAFFYRSNDSGAANRVITAVVKKGDLLITVTEDGNVESANNVELKCMVPGPITILEIVLDGSHVKKGDQLVRLDSSNIEDSILTQEIAVAKAEAAKISAEKDFSAAKIAVDEYEQGTLRREIRQAEADIVIAKQDLASAENQLHYSEKMARKGYVTPLDVQSKQFAVEQAKLNVEVAELTKDVLEKFTKAKTLEELKSKRDSAEALMNSEIAAFTKESNQLKRLQDQLHDCTIPAPQDGMVVYANERSNPFQQGPKIEQGAQVNQFQAVLRLPDLKNMQVKALVHETKVDQLRIGMRASIKIQDQVFRGEVTSISNQPEATTWFQGNAKEYATLIKIDGEPEGLKPGMTAELEILVTQKKGVLQVPVQCVVERANKFYAYVKDGQNVEVRNLVLGGTNDTVMEVVDGLKEGELVLLNPRADVPTAADQVTEADETDVSKRFGSAPTKTLPGASAPGGSTVPATGPGGTAGTGPGGATPPAASGAPATGGASGAGAFKLPTFKQLDKDGDGKLSREENPSPWFDKIDTNSDGSHDPKEFKAAMDQAKKMMSGQMGGGAPGGAGPAAPPR